MFGVIIGLGTEFVFVVVFFFIFFILISVSFGLLTRVIWDSVGLRWNRCFFRICGLGYGDVQECFLGIGCAGTEEVLAVCGLQSYL